MVGLFLLGGVASNVLTLVTFGQSGAGNSMATMALLVASVAASLRSPPHGRTALGALAVPALAAAALLVTRDQHGLALTLGLALGSVALVLGRPRRSPS